MVKVIGLGGAPATGKTTLVRNYATKNNFKYGLVRGSLNRLHDLYTIGIYNSELYSGTDKLSMAVQPDANNFILKLHEDSKTNIILFEGDRLFNSKTIEHCKRYNIPSSFIVLITFESILHERYAERGNSMSQQFINSRVTKYKNLLSAFPEIETWPSNTPDEKEKNRSALSYIVGF